MGYTHYWRANREFTDKEWHRICQDFRYCLAGMPNGIRIDDQEGGPAIVDGEKIWFNGAGDEGCETFALLRAPRDFQFCKTRRKPYDLMVQACLLIARHHSTAITVTSDGDNDEWAAARGFVKMACGYDPGPLYEAEEET